MLAQYPAFVRSRQSVSYTLPTRGNATLFSRKIRTKLVLPAEEITNTWKGSSEIVRIFSYSNTEKLSIINAIYNGIPNYVPVVAWSNGDGTKTRYKIWWDVGEILYLPHYTGQIIPLGFDIEIWTTNNNPIVLDNEELYLSKMILNTSALCICLLQEHNFLRVTTPSGTGILDENGNIILDEGGNTIQPE